MQCGAHVDTAALSALHYMPIRRIGVMTYNVDLALQDKQSRYTVGENNYLIPF